jgi:hypothetical protein
VRLEEEEEEDKTNSEPTNSASPLPPPNPPLSSIASDAVSVKTPLAEAEATATEPPLENDHNDASPIKSIVAVQISESPVSPGAATAEGERSPYTTISGWTGTRN